MITRLQGKILEKHAPYIVVDLQGLGYEVAVPMTTFYQLPEVDQSVVLHTHFVVREDAQLLYGFMHKTDRQLFRDLLKVNGIGAKMALAILSGMETEQFVQCVHDHDIAMLSKIPGIGKKTAERLIVEMRDRLSAWQGDAEAIGQGLDQALQGVVAQAMAQPKPEQDAIDALLALGYKPAEAKKAVQQISQKNSDMTSDQLIREALRKMVVA